MIVVEGEEDADWWVSDAPSSGCVSDPAEPDVAYGFRWDTLKESRPDVECFLSPSFTSSQTEASAPPPAVRPTS